MIPIRIALLILLPVGLGAISGCATTELDRNANEAKGR